MAGPRAGDVLDGRVRLERRLGSGGFSSVWRARDLSTETLVAVKILHSEFVQEPVVVGRFLQEAEILRRLEHPSIARGLSSCVANAPPFFTLEYVKGEDLQDRLRRLSSEGKPVPLAGVSWVCGQIARALVVAHRQGVIHRDLKPANVMVSAPHEPPFVKVLDFGAAKDVDGRGDPTTVGRVIGSIPYLTPEQLRQQGVDGRTDQFALAVLAYELMTLRRAWGQGPDRAPLPFHVSLAAHNTQLDIMRRILRGARPRPSVVRAEVPAAVDEVLGRALSIRPEARYPSVDAFMRAFREALLEEVARRHAGTEETVTMHDLDDTKPIEPKLIEDTLELPSQDLVLPVAVVERRAKPRAQTEARDLELTLEEPEDLPGPSTEG